MRGHVQLGKLVRRGRLNAVVPGQLLHVTDRCSQRRFLVDTGASYSILPYRSADIPSGPPLMGPDGTSLPCWGRRRVQLEFGHKQFTWFFLLSAVSFPIIAVDFLKHFKLLVDPANCRLLSSEDFPPSPALPADSCSHPAAATPSMTVSRPIAADTQVATFGDTELIRQFAAEFPAIFGMVAAAATVKHDIKHHLITTGPPIASKFRRLDGEKLAAAKAEFDRMEAEGIVQQSTSPWSSPLHMVQLASLW
jgi:hypothetical protein